MTPGDSAERARCVAILRNRVTLHRKIAEAMGWTSHAAMQTTLAEILEQLIEEIEGGKDGNV